MAEENTVFIGKKGTMAYVLAVVTQMNQQGSKEVTLKARGKAISRAVDVAEIVKNKFIKEISVKNIHISTEEVSIEDGNPLKVSAIEIKLSK
ncbi:MAG: archaea-specific DNA-binding protein [archaeon GW2011_AR10]|uniref:DNA/RNA-binding protein Alba n=1 Tax=Candidatus Iainarchaeum sp. TaxID=3101447 RepID=A0A7J4IVU8_9ARCH|nr:MAG: archaea-specific DNA-binding protein [archaeon GW2011_AR10]HIH08479.1 DNA-binding protein Alba [Candidatus Diapherotrites archaeon]